jgi:hypothetical protein
MELLLTDYENPAEDLRRLGFNSGVFNLKPRKREDVDILSDEEEQIQAIIDNKAMNKSGSLYKLGNVLANSRVVLEASKRVLRSAEESQKTKEQKKKDDEVKKNWSAIRHFEKWKIDGRHTDNAGRPKLGADAAKCMVKVLLPKIAPKEKMKDYTTMKKCVDCLVSVAGGTSWVDEMQHIVDETAGFDRLF